MRLLNSRNGQIKEFISAEDTPRYAILSHTWGEEEVTLSTWQALYPSPELERMKGYPKIRYCQTQSLTDGLEWVWIDTCCIDKTSSAELSEAINSMFRWYQQAVVCYVYLSDVAVGENFLVTMDNFSRSRWFTRGWTLQELIAPAHIVFYSGEWKLLGKKIGLDGPLSRITGIDGDYLLGKELEYASIAQRMSWASNRKTSRVEDMAYCLLGIFDINMSLIYGEGKKAFRRLQEEIMKAIPYDHTLFAWGVTVDWDSDEHPAALQGITGPGVPRLQSLAWDETQAEGMLMGLLAESPDDFRDSKDFIPSLDAEFYYRSNSIKLTLPQLISSEIRIELPLAEPYYPRSIYYWKQLKIAQLRPSRLAVLLCSSKFLQPSYLVMPLKGWGSSSFGRTKYLIQSKKDLSDVISGRREVLCIAPEQEPRLDVGDILFRQAPNFVGKLNMNLDCRYDWNNLVARSNPRMNGWLFNWCFKKLGERGWSIKFVRLPRNQAWLSSLSISIARVHFGEEYELKDWSERSSTWYHSSRADEPIEFCSHVMATPVDSWEPEGLPFQLIIRVERVFVRPDRTRAVDIVDMTLDEGF